MLIELYLLQNIFISFFVWRFFQGLQGGWMGKYSFACQPVDYSDDPTAVRVSNKFTQFNEPKYYC